MDAVAGKFKEFGRNDVLVSAFREMGGRGAGALIPSFVDGLEDGRQKSRDAGAVISAENIAKMDEAGDAFDRLKMILSAGLAPAIVWVSEALSSAVTAIQAEAAKLGTYFGSFDLLKIIKSNFSIEGIKGGGSIGEAARQFGAASPAADAAYMSVIEKAEAEKAAAAAARAAKIALQNKPQEIPVVEIKPTKDKPARDAIRGGAGFSDSLTSVGNFLGGGRSVIENLAQRQLKVQERMAISLDKLVNKKTADIKVP
jgi:hypothetical protein